MEAKNECIERNERWTNRKKQRNDEGKYTKSAKTCLYNTHIYTQRYDGPSVGRSIGHIIPLDRA